MFGVWLVLTVFILWALGVSLTRDEKTPRALWEAIIANAVFGALLYLRGLFLAQRRAGSFAMIAAIRRASSLLSNFAAERRAAKHPSLSSYRMQYYCLRAGQLYGAADGK
jgi:hypothetical protein